MFVKVVVVLLLLIVAASLLIQRTGVAGSPRRPAGAKLRPLFKRMALILLAIAAGVALVHFLSGCAPRDKGFHGRDISGADYARLEGLDGFVTHRGSRHASADFRGKAVLVFFGYTHCPDICPTTLASLRETMELLGDAADRVQVLFVTLDPERDTQAVLAEYAPWFDARFVGLRIDPEATRAAAQSFRVFYAKANAGAGGASYGIDHTADTYAYDPQGRVRLKLPHGATSQQIAEDIAKLLADQ